MPKSTNANTQGIEPKSYTKSGYQTSNPPVFNSTSLSNQQSSSSNNSYNYQSGSSNIGTSGSTNVNSSFRSNQSNNILGSSTNVNPILAFNNSVNSGSSNRPTTNYMQNNVTSSNYQYQPLFSNSNTPINQGGSQNRSLNLGTGVSPMSGNNMAWKKM